MNDMSAETSICAAVILVAMVDPHPDGAQQGTARSLETQYTTPLIKSSRHTSAKHMIYNRIGHQYGV